MSVIYIAEAGTYIYLRRPDKTVMAKKGAAFKYSAGSTYKNKDGDVFIATRAGQISTQKNIVASDWRYDRTNIIKAPSATATITSMKITGSVLTVGLKIPSSATDSSNNARASKIEYHVSLRIAGKGLVYSKYYRVAIASSLSINIDSLKGDDGKDLINWQTTTSLTEVGISVYLTNSKGASDVATKKIAISVPGAPTISEITQNESSGVLSATITAPSQTGTSPFRLVQWEARVYDSNNAWLQTRKVSGSFSSATATASIDLTERQLVTESRSLSVVFTARAVGQGGTNAAKQKEYRASIPKQPKLAISGKIGARATLSVDMRSDTIHPVTGIRAQKLMSVAYTQASQIPDNASWQNVGPTDNGACTGISIPKEELIPDPGTITWVRVKVWNAFESLWVNYSSPVRIRDLETPAPITPSAQGDKVYLLEANVLGSGTEVEVLLGWASNDAANYTELSWSDRENAWKSTDQPEVFTFADATWDEGPVTKGSTTYGSSTHVVISGLGEGQMYYITARRVLIPEDDGNTTYGKYCTKNKVSLSAENTAPTSVQLSSLSDTYVKGDDMRFFWDYGSSAVQESWALMASTNATIPHASDLVIASGSGNSRQCTVPWERSGKPTIQRLETYGYANVYAIIHVAGVSLVSLPVRVQVKSRPLLSVSASDVESLSRSITLYTDTIGSSVRLSIVSDGTAWDMPDGIHRQASGEVVYSVETEPQWTQSQNTLGYEAEIDIPDYVRLIDGAHYVCTCVETANGVRSLDARAEFDVDYDHKPVEPSDDIVAEEHDEIDEEDGTRSLYVDLVLAEPELCGEDDVYDVYRVANEVVSLVAEGLALDATMRDMYAPLGDSAEYRVALRTPEGGVSWLSATYSLVGKEVTESKFVRIDWPGSYVEIENGVSPSDAYSKPFKVLTHMDGTRSGHWGPSVQRTTSISAQFVAGRDEYMLNRLRELARYDGPCYIRTSDGMAMTCNVDVTVSRPLNTARIDVSISATEIDDDTFGVEVLEEEEEVEE